jgi:hypothetical protein
MLPDSGGKGKKRKKVFPFNNLALLNLDFAKKKLAKKGKKRQKTNYGSHPVFILISGIPLVSARRRISAMPLAKTKVSIQIVYVARNCY